MLKPLARLTLAALTLTACTASMPVSHSLVNVVDATSGQTFSYQSGTYQVARIPFPTAPWTDSEQTLLTLINATRAKGGTCLTTAGQTKVQPPSAALMFEGHLHDAALKYAQVLAQQDQMASSLSHTGPDGSLPTPRMIASGYTPTVKKGDALTLQESLAAMQPYDAAQVISARERSPLHCATLYSPLAKDVGLGIATAASGTTDIVLDVGGLSPNY